MKKARQPSKSQYTTISIPTPLFEKTRVRLNGTGFTSVSSYVTFVLREILSTSATEKKPRQREAFAAEDEARVKSRLRGLGYKF